MSAPVIGVWLPTTEAMVEILGLKELPPVPGVLSAMCRDGSSDRVGVSRSYHDFVKSPTGCIEAMFGHGAFRMDVSDRVDQGDSWQLAVLMAHAARAVARLSEPLHEDVRRTEVLLCATGRVLTTNLAVGDVSEIPTKLALAEPKLLAARQEGKRVVLALPMDNAPEIPAPMRKRLEAAGVEILAVKSARDLAAALDLPPLQPEAAAATVAYRPGTNPYPGLRAFAQQERALFFGRSRAREQLLRRLRGNATNGMAFVLVHGRSGIGKSSLLRAGLTGDVLQHCRSEGSWRVVEVTCAPSAQVGPPGAVLLDRIAPGSTTAAQLLEALPEDAQVLLLLDQFEQALIGLPEAEARDLGEVLLALATSGRVWIAASIRSDQLDAVDNVPGLARMVRDSRSYRLEPPTPFELSEMILKPAAQVGLRFAPGPEGDSLPERLVGIAMRSPSGIPLLQVVLERLARMADTDGTIKHGTYAELGEFENALKHLAEDVLARLPPGTADQALIDRTLSRLIRFDPESGRPLSRPVSRPAPGDPAAGLLDHLVAGRLLVEDAGATGLRLAHEILFDAWPRLRDLVLELRDDLPLRDWLETAAADWHASGGDRDLLVASEGRVEEAERLIAAGRVAVSDTARALVAESRRQIARRLARRRRLATGVAAGCAAMAVLAGGALWGFNEARSARAQAADDRALSAEHEGRARVAEDRALGLWALNLADSDPVAALRIALSGWPEDPTVPHAAPELHQQAIATALGRPRPLVTFDADDMGTVAGAQVSPDGLHLLSWYFDAPSVHLWSTATGEVLHRFSAHGDEPAMHGMRPHLSGGTDFAGFLGDGAKAFVVQGDAMTILDVTSGLPERRIPLDFASQSSVLAVSASQNGGHVALAASSGLVWLWSRADGRITRFAGWHQHAISAVAFSPADDRLLVTGSRNGQATLWDVSGQVEPRQLPRHGPIHRLTFSTDGRNLAVLSEEGVVRVWNVETGDMVSEVDQPGVDVTSVGFSEDGTHLVMGTRGGIVVICDLAGVEVARLSLPPVEELVETSFLPGGHHVLTASHDGAAVTRWFMGPGSLQIWDPAIPVLRRQLPAHQALVRHVAIHPDGRWIATGTDTAELRLWDSATGELVRSFTLPAGARIAALAFAEADSTLLAVDKDGVQWRLEPAMDDPAMTDADLAEVDLVALSPDGRHLLSANGHGEALLRSIADPGHARALADFEGLPTEAVFSGDGRYLMVSFSNSPKRIWNLETGASVDLPENAALDGYRAVFSASGNLLADIGGSGAALASAKLHDVRTGTVRWLEGHHAPITGMVFASDDRLITAHSDGTVAVLDLETDTVLARLTGHRDQVEHVSLSLSGAVPLLTTFDQSGRVIVRDGQSMALLHRIDLEPGSFDPDALRFVTPSTDGRFHVMNFGRSAVILRWGAGAHVGNTLADWGCAALAAIGGPAPVDQLGGMLLPGLDHDALPGVCRDADTGGD